MTVGKPSSSNPGLALVSAGFFFLILASFLAVTYIQSPRPRVPPRRPPDVNAIAGWMTVRYISRAYAVPETVLLDALKLSEEQARHQSLDHIARLKHQSSDETI